MNDHGTLPCDGVDQTQANQPAQRLVEPRFGLAGIGRGLPCRGVEHRRKLSRVE